jgi:hypothetical protein
MPQIIRTFEKNSSDLAVIAVFAFNRPKNLEACIESLKLNQESKLSKLVIYIDKNYCKENEIENYEVKNFAKNITGFSEVKVIERMEHFGLYKNIVTGITDSITLHKKLIILEDDLTVGKYFLKYMNDALNKYEKDGNIFCISGYSYFPDSQGNDTYVIADNAENLGWGTWANRWEKIEWDNKRLIAELIKSKKIRNLTRDNSYSYLTMLKNNIETKKSWAINWLGSACLHGGYTLYPSKNMVLHDSQSTNFSNYNWRIDGKDPLNIPITQDALDINKATQNYNVLNEIRYRFWLIKFEKSKILKFLRVISQVNYILKVIFRILKRAK